MTRIAALGLCAALTTACGGRSCGTATPTAAAGMTTSGAPRAVGSSEMGPGLKRPLDAAHALPVAPSADLANVDPAAYADALGRDPVRIFEFVRDQIAYEPYAGCLRGARGTLMSMAGNSVDRAVLLGAMLGAAGQQIRYVRGTLPDAAAQVLVTSIWADRPWTSASKTAQAPADVAATGRQLIDWMNRDVALVGNRLASAPHDLPDAAHVTMASMVAEARSHYWVQWSQDGNWTDLDPSFASATPGSAYAAGQETFDRLPDALYHRFDLRVRVEEYTGDEVSTRDLLRYTARSADLSGMDLFLTHDAEDPKNMEGRVRPRLAVPGQEVVGDWFALRAPHQDGQGMLDAFGGGDSQAPVAAAESIEMEFAAPDGHKESIAREIFDRVGPARRRAGQKLTFDDLAARAVAAGPGNGVGLYDLFVTTGFLDPVHAGETRAPATKAPPEIRQRLRSVAHAFVGASDAATSRIAGDGWVCRFYADTPRVHIADVTIKNDMLRTSLDLRRSAARQVVTGLTPAQAFDARVARGVLEGSLERAVLRYFAGSSRGPEGVSTSLVFERAAAGGIPAVLLSGPDASGVSGPDDGRARVENALASGSLVVAPREAIEIDGVPRLAWWDIDRRTGSTTAVTDEGLHQMVTYTIQVYKGQLIVVLTVGGTSLAVPMSSPAAAASFIAGLQAIFRTVVFVQQFIKPK